MYRRLIARMRDEKGAALPTVAILMVVLLGMTAFAVDLGWVYLNAARLQKTADAAALAGVVHLPSDLASAYDDAGIAVDVNGWSGATMVATPLPDNQLQVDLTATVDTFFLSVFGIDSMDVTRRATAQYILPVPLGSPDQCFGSDPTGTFCATDPHFWAAISGPQTNQWNGDAYATQCIDTGGSWNCEHTNPRYRSNGYYYAVDTTGTTGPLSVYLYDAGFYERADFYTETGDLSQDGNGGTNTTFQLRDVDSTPYDPTNNVAISGCSASIAANADAPQWKNKWKKLCTLGSTVEGIYVLQVSSSGSLGGTNQYSIAASVPSGNQPRVYALNDMSLFNNVGGIATINLAEIEAVHAGKTLVIDLFDPGEDNGNAYLSIVDPSGATTTCTYDSETDLGAAGPSGSGTCRIQTSTGSPVFNGKWLEITVDIPGSYSCSTDCWWQVEYELSNPHDRTTWAARVIGNPVRLVPNQP